MEKNISIKNSRLIILIGMIISALFGLGMILYIDNQSEQFNFNNYNIVSPESSSSMKIQLEILRYCKNKYEILAEESKADPYSLEGMECFSGDNPFGPENIYYCHYKNSSSETGTLTKFSKSEWIDDCIDWRKKEIGQ